MLYSIKITEPIGSHDNNENILGCHPLQVPLSEGITQYFYYPSRSGKTYLVKVLLWYFITINYYNRGNNEM